jgi:hypothetical protein
MYQVKRRGNLYRTDLTYTPETVGDSSVENLKFLSAEIDVAVNERGSFVFKIAPTHAYYGTFKKLEHALQVRINNEDFARPVHYFRVIGISRDFWDNEIITCEGLIGMLGDCLALPYFADTQYDRLIEGGFDEQESVSTITLAKIVSWLLYDSLRDQHAGSFRYSHAVTEPSDTSGLARSCDGTQSVLAEMLDIIDSFGGYLCVSNVIFTDSAFTPTYYYKSAAPPGKTCTQTIEYGKNLLDLTVHEDVDDMYTSCLAVGDATGTPTVKQWGSEGSETARDQNDGALYVDYSEQYIKQYGRRVIFKHFDGLTNPSDIYNAARGYLRQLIRQNTTIEIKAIDLKAVDSTQDGFTAGDNVHIVSDPHGIDDTYLCAQAHIDLCDMSKSYYVFGASFKRISSMIKK